MKVVLSNSLRKRLLMMSDNVFAKALLGDTYCEEMLYLSDDKDDPGRITFIEPDKLKRYGYFFRWSKKRRSDRTAARTIRIIFPDLRDSYYEEFHNLFISTATKVSLPCLNPLLQTHCLHSASKQSHKHPPSHYRLI